MIELPNPLPWPVVACSVEELNRLRVAYTSSGPEHDVVAERVARARKDLATDPAYPPEGGQHNQWYQCKPCQMGLETVDATHHRCPKCGEVYSGYPYDNVLYKSWHGRNAGDMADAAWAYAITGEEAFGRRAREMLLAYSDLYLKYPHHSSRMGKRDDPTGRTGGHVMEQTLSESSWMLSVADAYDLVRTSDILSESDHETIREGLFLPLYENTNQNQRGKSNWQTYHNAAILAIGAVLGRADLIDQALNDPEHGFHYQMEVSVLPGGMWYENSWGYHFYPLEAVRRMTETSRYLGIDLYEIPQVKEMYTVALDYVMADGTLPRTADATTQRIPGSRYETAYHQWKDLAFVAVLPSEPTWQSVQYGRTEFAEGHRDYGGSILEKGGGHAILRANGPEGPASVAMSYGPFGGGHGHFDKLSFVYFALGEEQGYDPGRARSQAYRLPVHRNWYKATTSHNTVIVDRASQEGVTGHPELFLTNDEVSAAAAYVDEAYENVVHHRLIVLRPDYLLTADILDTSDGNDHTFDWTYHNLGESITSAQATEVAAPDTGQGFEYVEDCRRGATEGDIASEICNGENQTNVMVVGSGASEVMIGTGPGESVMDRVPTIFVTRRGTSARFVATIDPTPADGEPTVGSVTSEDVGDGVVVTVTLTDGVREVYAYHSAGLSREVNGFTTTSKLICLKSDGDGWAKLAESD
jgi:oligo-alginate lyase